MAVVLLYFAFRLVLLTQDTIAATALSLVGGAGFAALRGVDAVGATIIFGLLTERALGRTSLRASCRVCLALGYLVAVLFAVWVNPELAPEVTEPLPISRQDMIGEGATAALFTLLMVGSYGGLFTPREAAGKGLRPL